jgi:hypothetical protein
MKFIIIITFILVELILVNMLGVERMAGATSDWNVASTISLVCTLVNVTLGSYVLIKKRVAIPILIINIILASCCMFFKFTNGTIIPWGVIAYTSGFCSVIALLKRIILDPILALIRKKNNPSCMR